MSDELVAEILVVLNLCRIMIKNRDQRPDEMKILDAVKIVIAKIEQEQQHEQ